MAATDQHYRSQKLLDIIFGVSCGALLLSTIWMFAQDFNRDYKEVQRKFRDVEAGLAEHDMIEKMPDAPVVVAKREALSKARARLASKKASLADEERTIIARRERADQDYRDQKAE